VCNWRIPGCEGDADGGLSLQSKRRRAGYDIILRKNGDGNGIIS